MVGQREQFVELRVIGIFQVGDDGNARVSSDLRGTDHAGNPAIVHEQNACSQDHRLARPVLIGPNHVIHVEKDRSRVPSRIDDDARPNGTGVHQLPNERYVDLVLAKLLEDEPGMFVVAKRSGIGAAASEASRRDQRGGRQSATVPLAPAHLRLGVGCGVRIHVQEFIDGHIAESNDVERTSSAVFSRIAVCS